MILLTDNDILIKLCALDLMRETVTWLGVSEDHIRVLHSAEPYVRKNRVRLASQYGADALDRATALLAKAKETRTGSPEEDQLLRNVNGISAGEAILMGATSKYPDYAFLTDDIRSLNALACSNECRRIAERLEKRVYCFLLIVLRLIEKHGWDALKPKILAKRHVDGRLRRVFADAESIGERSLLVRLREDVAALRARTRDLLA